MKEDLKYPTERPSILGHEGTKWAVDYIISLEAKNEQLHVDLTHLGTCNGMGKRDRTSWPLCPECQRIKSALLVTPPLIDRECISCKKSFKQTFEKQSICSHQCARDVHTAMTEGE